MQGTSGSQRVTSDLAVGVSGKPCRVFGVHILSGGGGGGVVQMRNGTTTSGTIYTQEAGTTSTGKYVNYGTYGILFPDGCFCDVDANVVACLCSFVMEA